MPRRIPSIDGTPNTASSLEHPKIKIIAAKLPDGEPPYEEPLDLRFPLHFSIGPTRQPNQFPEVREAAEALRKDFLERYDQGLELTSALVGPQYPRQRRGSPEVFLVTIYWEEGKPYFEDVDYVGVYWTAMEFISKHFPKDKFGEKEYPWLYPPTVRLRLKKYVDGAWDLLD